MTPRADQNRAAAAVARFRRAGWSASLAAEAVAAGLDEQTAWIWIERGDLTHRQCLAWWTALNGPGSVDAVLQMRRWADAGVKHPDKRPDGVSSAVALMCSLAGVPASPDWGERVAPHSPSTIVTTAGPWLCPTLVRHAADCGQEPLAAGRLLDALLPLMAVAEDAAAVMLFEYDSVCQHLLSQDRGVGPYGRRSVKCGWHPEQVQQVREFLTSVRSLDWDDLAVCLCAGLTPQEAAEYVAAGREMGPVRLTAALTC